MPELSSIASVSENIFWLGWQDCGAPMALRPFGGAGALRQRPSPPSAGLSNLFESCMHGINSIASVSENIFWLGWQDSNLRVPGSKPGALPLGDTPFGGGRYCAFAGCGCQTECESGGHALLGAENLVQMRSFGGAGRSQGVGALRYDEIDAASLFLRGDAPRQNAAWKRLEAVVVYPPVQLLKAR